MHCGPEVHTGLMSNMWKEELFVETIHDCDYKGLIRHMHIIRVKANTHESRRD